MHQPKVKKSQLLKIMPFKVLTNPGLDVCLYTTSRPEKIMKFDKMNMRTKSSTLFDPLSKPESSKIFSSISEASLKQLSDSISHNSTLSPNFGENMSRISNLRYSHLNTPSLMQLPPLKSNTSLFKQNLPKIEIIEEAPDSERGQIMYKKQLGYWSILKCEGVTPRCGENSQVVVIDSLLVVCGGQSFVKHCELKVLDLKTRRWRIVKVSNSPKGRLGHTMVNYKHKLFIFGGWGTSENLERRTQSKMFIFSMNKNTWEKCFGNGDRPMPRQYHAACQLGRNMLVYGGIDNKSRLTSDLYILDLKDIMWKLPEITVMCDPGPRSHCTLTPVFHQTLKSTYNFNIEKIPKLKDEYTLANSAFYLFGGLKANRVPCNDLHALYLRNGKLIWSEVKYAGVAPSPRYSHTAHAIHSSLFIYGGRNDFTSGHTQSALNDLFVFNVTAFKWERADVFGSIPEGRWAHGMTSFNTSLIVFGGITYSKFMSADIYLLETSRVEAERKIQSDNNKGNNF